MSKFRSSFVTNSSSSSFICEVCNHIECEMDLSMSDAGFVRCVNGHEFCEDHKLETKVNIKDELKNVLEEVLERYFKRPNYWAEEIVDIKRELLELNNMSEYKVKKLLNQYIKNEVLAACCPICALDTIRNSDILMYISKKTGVETSKVKQEIQQQFKTLSEFEKFLKESD